MTSTPGGATERPWFVGTQNDDLFIINKPPRPSHDHMADIPDVAVIARLNACNDEANAALILAAIKAYDAPDSKLEAYSIEDAVHAEGFIEGVNHTVEVFVKLIEPADTWHHADGSEDHDIDLANTFLNILAAKGLYDPETAEFTAPPKPALPAVDSRVQQSGVYGGTRVGTVTKSTATTFTVAWDKRTVACTYDRDYLKSDAQYPIVVLPAPVPPPDGAAERAAPERCPHCFDETDCSNIDVCNAAADQSTTPPSDDVRSTLADDIEAGRHLSLAQDEGFAILSSASKAQIIAALRSAPVSAAANFDPTNHHNALKCPYCNPKGLSFTSPQHVGRDAPVPARDAVIAECAKIAEGYASTTDSRTLRKDYELLIGTLIASAIRSLTGARP